MFQLAKLYGLRFVYIREDDSTWTKGLEKDSEVIFKGSLSECATFLRKYKDDYFGIYTEDEVDD